MAALRTNGGERFFSTRRSRRFPQKNLSSNRRTAFEVTQDPLVLTALCRRVAVTDQAVQPPR
jgi:hypothetical protein